MTTEQLRVKDPRTYSVFGLLVAGSRFTDDYGADDAVRQYLELHPDADEKAVRDELDAELAKHAA